MQSVKRKLDWLRGPPSPFKYKAIKPGSAKIPIRYNLKSLQSPVHDQGQSGSCVGNAVANHLEFLQLKALKAKIPSPEVFPDTGPDVFNGMAYDPISRLFIYYNARSLEGMTQYDSGCNIYDAVASIQKTGFCQESIWPFNLNNMYTQPSKAAFAEASNHRAIMAYSIDNSDDIKICLASGYPVVFGTDVYRSFENVGKNGVYPGPTGWERSMGGHCMLIVAYDDYYQSFTVKNSWGTGWADKGYCYVSYDFAEQFADMHTIR